MGMFTMTFCDVRNNVTDGFIPSDDELAVIENLQATMGKVMACLCLMGIGGNVLNLKTLQSSTLQTVPFMYIRALALFDLIGLIGVLVNVISKSQFGSGYWNMAYKSHIEPVLINTFFIGGLYCAFMLTVERSLLIARPHYRQTKPKRNARIRITLAWIAAFILHIPLGFQFTPVEKNGGWTIGNNVDLLCNEPLYTFYYYYKFVREGLRLITVVLMAVLNGVIAYKLQQTKKRRREMLCQRATTAAMLCSTASTASARSSIVVGDSRSHNYSTTGLHGNNPSFSSTSSSGGRQSRTRNEEARRADLGRGGSSSMVSVYRSFTEKKLTVLMVAICVIYLMGNLPQMIIMSVQDESKEGVYKFQLLRHGGNCMEVLNHCLNFYVFCVASSEYSRAFLLNCSCFRRAAARVPFLKRFAQAPLLTGASVVSINAPRDMMTDMEMGDLSNSSGGRKISTIPNEAALSASQEDNIRKVSSEQGTSSGSSQVNIINTLNGMDIDEEERKPLRGILINSGRRLSCSFGIRQKRSLTIVNDGDVDNDDIEKVEASL